MSFIRRFHCILLVIIATHALLIMYTGSTSLSSTESTTTLVSLSTGLVASVRTTTISSTPEPPMPTDSDITDFEPTSNSMSGTPTSTELHGNHETTTTTIASGEGGSAGLLAAVIGGVAGSLLVFVLLSLVLLLLLVLVWRTKKYKLRIAANNARCNHNHDQEPQLEGSKRLGEEQRRGDEVMMMEVNDAYISNTQQILTADNVAYGQQQHQGDEAIEMNSNNSHIPTRQISTEDNVAYGRATPQITLVDNVAYDQATPQIFTADYNNGIRSSDTTNNS